MRNADLDPRVAVNVSDFDQSSGETRRTFLAASDEGLRLIRAFVKIQDHDRRKAVLQFVQDLSKLDL